MSALDVAFYASCLVLGFCITARWRWWQALPACFVGTAVLYVVFLVLGATP